VDKCPTEYLPARPPPSEAIFNVFELKKQPEIVRYYHAAAGFPTKPMWIKAINNKQYASWPGLTSEIVQKYYPESEETIKGHASKNKSGLRSTKKPATRTTNVITQTDTPSREEPAETIMKTKEIFVTTYDIQDDFQKKMYTDQTGRFPTKSSRGNQYVMVLVESDSNAILVTPMKNRTSKEMINAYQE